MKNIRAHFLYGLTSIFAQVKMFKYLVTVVLFRLQASRMSFTHKDMHHVTKKEVKAMEDIRKKIGEVFPDKNLAFPYSEYYLAWETNKVGQHPWVIASLFLWSRRTKMSA